MLRCLSEDNPSSCKAMMDDVGRMCSRDKLPCRLVHNWNTHAVSQLGHLCMAGACYSSLGHCIPCMAPVLDSDAAAARKDPPPFPNTRHAQRPISAAEVPAEIIFTTVVKMAHFVVMSPWAT